MFAASRGRARRGVQKDDRDQAKVQGLSTGAEVGSCASPAGLGGKGKEILRLTPPPSLLCKIEVESRRKTREFH